MATAVATTTIDRINQLSAERGRLYREASNGRRGDPKLLAKIHVIDAEIERLWDIRRQEKAVRRDVIDLLIDRAYAEVYGRRYEEAVAPLAVAEPVAQAA